MKDRSEHDWWLGENERRVTWCEGWYVWDLGQWSILESIFGKEEEQIPSFRGDPRVQSRWVYIWYLILPLSLEYHLWTAVLISDPRIPMLKFGEKKRREEWAMEYVEYWKDARETMVLNSTPHERNQSTLQFYIPIRKTFHLTCHRMLFC